MHLQNFTPLLSFLSIASAVNLAPRDCAPGGSFDLSKWNLQLPTGEPKHPEQKTPDELVGCSGYQDSRYFHIANENGNPIQMTVPEFSKCVTTTNSKHCRTEFREIKPSKWDPRDTKNRLRAEVAVSKLSDKSVVVGQIHIDDDESKLPVAELFYLKDGTIQMCVEKSRDESSLTCEDGLPNPLGKVELGERFSYEIRYEKNVLCASLNGGTCKEFSTFGLDAPQSYFKIGNYNQGQNEAVVKVYSFEVEHS